MKFAGLVLAMLTLTLVFTACESETPVVPDDRDSVAPAGGDAAAKEYDLVYYQTLADQINALTWRRLTCVIDKAGGYQEFRPPNWPQDMVFSVRLIPTEQNHLVPGTEFQTIHFEFPRWPVDADEGPLSDGGLLPVRWWHLPEGDFTVELGLCFAPWNDPEDCNNLFSVYDLGAALAGRGDHRMFEVVYPPLGDGAIITINHSECPVLEDPATKIIDPKGV